MLDTSRGPFQRSESSGLTLVQLIIVIGALMVLTLATVTALVGSQNVFVQNQTMSRLQLRAQIAMDRIVALSSQAVTGDAEFSPLKPNTGVDSHALRFRLIDAIDPLTGTAIYDDDLKVYVYGPDDGDNPCAGLIIGRGPSLDAVHSIGAGADGLLGTGDDITASISDGIPAVELLIPSTFAPQIGEMLQIDMEPAPIGRFITFTLRLNARDANDNFVLANDVVLTTNVALRE